MELELQSQSLLIATRKLLTPEERWQQDANFDDAHQPQRFCLIGGLIWSATGKTSVFLDATQTEDLRQASSRLRVTLGAASEGSVVRWNDESHRTHAEVLKLLDDTIGQEAK